MRIVALAMVVGLAGCISAPSAPSLDAVTDAPEAITTWYGFSDGNLLQEAVGGVGYPLNWGWQDYVAGTPAPAWMTEEFTQAAMVTSATLTLHYQIEAAAQLELPARPFTRPPLTSWFGTEFSTISHEFADGPAATTNDDITVTWDIELPPGGLWVPEGVGLQVRVGTYYLHYEGIRLDGSQSRLDVTLQPVNDPALSFSPEGHVTHTVAGGACVVRDGTGTVDAELRQAAVAIQTIEVPEEALALTVNAWSTVGDMDFWLEDPEGTDMGHALGSTNEEVIHLGPSNMDGRAGTWTLYAYACSPTDGTLHATWDIGTPA